MKEIGRYFLLCLIWTCSMTARAADGLHFEHIDTRGHTVYGIYRATDGVVWVGTSNGLTTLAQLQGNFPFIYMRHKMLNEFTYDVKQDNIGRLWLTVLTEHLVVYDAHQNKVITQVPDYLRTLGMPDINEQLTAIGPQGKLWTSNGQIIYCYDFSKKTCRKISLPAQSGKIVALQNDGSDILVATPHHIYGITPSSCLVEHLGVTPQPITNHLIILARDKGRDLWLASENKCYRLSKGSDQWEDLHEVHHVKGIVTTKSGQTFVATSNYGLYIYHPGSSQPVHLKQAAPNTDGLQSNHIESLYYDEGLETVVISYNKGFLSMVTPKSDKYASNSMATVANQYHPEDVIAFASASDGRSFWAGSEDGGIFRIESSGNMSILENQKRGHTVTALFSDSNRHLWTGIYNEGLFSDDGKCHFPGSSPYSIVQPVAGGRLFVAMLGQGILTIDPLTGATGHVTTDNPWITDLAACHGKLYAVTNSFLYEIDGTTSEVRQMPLSLFGEQNNLQEGHRDLYADKRGWLWLVSNVNHSPLYLFETATGKTHALPEMGKYTVYSISGDQKDHIWCTTDQGLVRITTDGKQFQYSKYVLNINHDYHYNPRALYALPNGMMVAGTSRGLISFNPQLLVEDTHTHTASQAPLITLLRINGVVQQPFTIDTENLEQAKSENGIKGDIIYTRELNLDHEQKNLVIACRPRGFLTDMANPYYYNLKGYSKEWLPVNNELIILSNLPPGKYDLLLRMGNTNEETTESYNMLHITIRPPFWKSPWGIALWTVISALIITGLYLFIRNKRNYRREIKRIKLQKQQEAELNEMKTRFFTNVSHDLRTPLTLIMAPVDELIKRFSSHPTSDNTLKILQTVKQNANHLHTLVNQILDVRRLETSYESLQTTPTDICKLLSELAATYSALADKRHIHLQVELPQGAPVLQIDNDKISKIVNNLLSNSFKFTPDDGTISLRCALQDEEEGCQMSLSVADTGHGISEQDMPHIFDRFYYSKQLQSSHESSGIGLSIVKQYTEMMGGTIRVEKNSPQGTVFTISMPVERVVEDAEWQQSVRNEIHDISSASAATEKPTILIVDDNIDLLRFMASSLQDDCHVLTAVNGAAALRILNDERQVVDVVVSDVMMPGIDGFELTRRIKRNADTSHIPVILLTAKALEEEQLKGLQMGASDYITKPFSIDILKLRINSWMQRRQSAHERFSSQKKVEPEELTITTLDQQLLEKAVNVVSEHMHEPDFNVDKLASLIGMHRSGLNRKLQFIIGMTPILFIRQLRLKRARQLMEADPALPISQVAYQVGFNNPKAFSKYFFEEYGCNPSEYIRNNDVDI